MGSPGSRESEPPIWISKIGGRHLLFDTREVARIRRESNISAVLIGTSHQCANQNIFLGLPAEMTGEDAAFLEERGIAMVRDDGAAHSAMLSDQGSVAYKQYLAKVRSERRTDGARIRGNTSGLLPGKSTGDKMGPEMHGPRRGGLHRHILSQGRYIIPGLRFGCQYSVYPGDPFRYHSHFLANQYSLDEEIPVMDLVRNGRLATSVKKGFVLGGEGEGEGERERERGSNATDGHQVTTTMRTFSMEWAAM